MGQALPLSEGLLPLVRFSRTAAFDPARKNWGRTLCCLRVALYFDVGCPREGRDRLRQAMKRTSAPRIGVVPSRIRTRHCVSSYLGAEDSTSRLIAARTLKELAIGHDQSVPSTPALSMKSESTSLLQIRQSSSSSCESVTSFAPSRSTSCL